MDWTFEDFHPELEDLVPEVREMALQIAKRLAREQNFPREKAIAEGIKKAEEWFLNSQG
jgi:uncharacterized protein YdaT